MNIMILLNDPPYGTERSFNGLRLALSLYKRDSIELCIFLMADAASCGKFGQETPNGYYNIERMLKGLTTKGIKIAACGSCMDARGLKEIELAPGVHRGSMEELTDWTIWADKVIVF